MWLRKVAENIDVNVKRQLVFSVKYNVSKLLFTQLINAILYLNSFAIGLLWQSVYLAMTLCGTEAQYYRHWYWRQAVNEHPFTTPPFSSRFKQLKSGRQDKGQKHEKVANLTRILRFFKSSKLKKDTVIIIVF